MRRHCLRPNLYDRRSCSTPPWPLEPPRWPWRSASRRGNDGSAPSSPRAGVERVLRLLCDRVARVWPSASPAVGTDSCSGGSTPPAPWPPCRFSRSAPCTCTSARKSGDAVAAVTVVLTADRRRRSDGEPLRAPAAAPRAGAGLEGVQRRARASSRRSAPALGATAVIAGSLYTAVQVAQRDRARQRSDRARRHRQRCERPAQLAGRRNPRLRRDAGRRNHPALRRLPHCYFHGGGAPARHHPCGNRLVPTA